MASELTAPVRFALNMRARKGQYNHNLAHPSATGWKLVGATKLGLKGNLKLTPINTECRQKAAAPRAAQSSQYPHQRLNHPAHKKSEYLRPLPGRPVLHARHIRNNK